ncbi:ABATE domain-containing protein [Streptomyces sp. SS10]
MRAPRCRADGDARASASARRLVRRVGPDGHGPRADQADLAAAVALRESVYAVTAAALAGERLPADALAEVNRHAAGLPVQVQLGDDGARRTGSVSRGLASLAREARWRSWA